MYRSIVTKKHANAYESGPYLLYTNIEIRCENNNNIQPTGYRINNNNINII